MTPAVYGEYSKSIGPKILLTLLHGLSLYVVYWLFFRGGLVALSLWAGRSLLPGAFSTRALLFSCALVYFLRVVFGCFYLIRRTMRWGEAIGIGFFVFLVHIFFALIGGTNPHGPGAVADCGAFLYVVGSYLNTGSEFMRRVWKKDPAHQGQLYTGGLFRYARHINYFGDEVLFIGYALVTGSLLALVVPAFMALGFIIANIPALDRYLARRYSDQFDVYATRTKRFIPFVY
ncbi:MAG: methyltransferase family protein [Candidatus Acidiferrales bacterium]